MYKKGLRSMPRAIKKELQLQYDIKAKDLISLQEKDPALALQTDRALASIKGLPSYWLVVDGAEEGYWPFIVFERKLNYDLEKALWNNTELSFSISSCSLSPYYGIY